jgi:hypothetical protein
MWHGAARKPDGVDFVWNSKISSFPQNPLSTALMVFLYLIGGAVGDALAVARRWRVYYSHMTKPSLRNQILDARRDRSGQRRFSA